MTVASCAVAVVANVKDAPIPSLATLEAQAAPVGGAARTVTLDKGLPAYREGSLVHSTFVMQRDDASVASLKKHIAEVDVVFPDWFTFTGEKPDITRDIDPDLQRFLQDSGVQVIPTIANLAPGQWMGETFSSYLATPRNRTVLSHLILEQLSANSLKGIDLDFEQLTPASMPHYLTFLRELTTLLHAHDMSVLVDLPLDDDTFDYPLIASIVDTVVVMAYDEHYETSKPGPIASEAWFREHVGSALSKIPAAKALVALGQYAYDWNTTKGTGESADYSTAIETAAARQATITTDDAALNSTFSYRDLDGDQHEVWMLDAVSLWNQLRFLDGRPVYGVSLWRTGSEDPTIWDFYSAKASGGAQVGVVERARALESSTYSGDGEFLTVERSPQDGARELTVRDGIIYRSTYTTYPTGFGVKRSGLSPARNVALTFDDGPDPVYTGQILDILTKYNVKATFFVVGESVSRWPDVVRRAVAEGHPIGSHTFYHTDDTEVVDSRFTLELDATQRAMRAVSQRASTLFRQPYNVDSQPATSDVLHPLDVVAHLGYTTVNADIDSDDFANPGVPAIVDTVLNGLDATGSNVVLFHDGGGDRAQTVAALEQLIPTLQAKGYNLVAPSHLLNVPQDKVMRELSWGEGILAFNDGFWMDAALWIHDWAWRVVSVLFLATILLSVARISLLGFLVLRSRFHTPGSDPGFRPFVSILIPAYNEDQVISKTLDALLRSDYSDYEVLVIDDGSQDSTREVVERYSAHSPRVRCLSKPNGGKFSALNLALEQARGDYVVTIDADTLVFPNTVTALIAPFSDPSVDAVCGNVKVGNARNLLTRFQSVEYITTQNFDRRAFEAINCISVVPGATGAWKKSSVLRIGGYCGETLTEDADLTLTLVEDGGKVVYAPEAVSSTEAPETLRDLYKQRFRWSFGIYQSLWKHRRSFFKGSLGWIALPNMLIFQLFWPLLSPIGDLVFLYALVTGNAQAIVVGYATFLLLDVAASVVAFSLDKEPYRAMWPILIQRFYYRQFMYIVTFRTVLAALAGRRHAWNKLNRRNSVNSPPPKSQLPGQLVYVD
ncbi:MAG: glycosyltransferase, partial [Propionicimonas sp.]